MDIQAGYPKLCDQIVGYVFTEEAIFATNDIFYP